MRSWTHIGATGIAAEREISTDLSCEPPDCGLREVVDERLLAKGKVLMAGAISEHLRRAGRGDASFER
jgi:hypothetical protein